MSAPTIPLRNFAQAYCRGWELHRIGSGWYAVKRKDSAGKFEELKPFPECTADLPKEVRALFIEAHSDATSKRQAVAS